MAVCYTVTLSSQSDFRFGDVDPSCASMSVCCGYSACHASTFQADFFRGKSPSVSFQVPHLTVL